MTRKWALDASPTILLAKISLISLVAELCSEAIIPSGVAQEIQVGPDEDPAKKWLMQKGNIKEVSQIEPTVVAWDLGLGENHVLSWCYQNEGYEAILDDGLARKCALSLGIPMRGTLGIILLAKQEGCIDEVKPFIEELIKVGFRIDTKTVKTVLDLANESI